MKFKMKRRTARRISKVTNVATRVMKATLAPAPVAMIMFDLLTPRVTYEPIIRVTPEDL